MQGTRRLVKREEKMTQQLPAHMAFQHFLRGGSVRSCCHGFAVSPPITFAEPNGLDSRPYLCSRQYDQPQQG